MHPTERRSADYKEARIAKAAIHVNSETVSLQFAYYSLPAVAYPPGIN